MNKKYSIFISSTYEDLKGEREVLRNIIVDSGHIPLGMEAFPATNASQMSYIKKIIDNCDYYILIVGGRYGSLSRNGISYTEMEYDYAKSQEKPILVFIHDDVESLPSKCTEQDSDLRSKLETFKSKISENRIVKYWNNKEKLEKVVILSLTSAYEDSPSAGWVRGGEKNNQESSREVDDYIFKIRELSYKNEEVSRKLLECQQLIYNQYIDKTKPATKKELTHWLEGAKENHSYTSGIASHQFARYADKDVIVPTDSREPIVLIVKEGVRVYKTSAYIHNCEILYMDGFRKEGGSMAHFQ